MNVGDPAEQPLRAGGRIGDRLWRRSSMSGRRGRDTTTTNQAIGPKSTPISVPAGAIQIVVRFTEAGIIRGATSVAVRTR